MLCSQSWEQGLRHLSTLVPSVTHRSPLVEATPRFSKLKNFTVQCVLLGWRGAPTHAAARMGPASKIVQTQNSKYHRNLLTGWKQISHWDWGRGGRGGEGEGELFNGYRITVRNDEKVLGKVTQYHECPLWPSNGQVWYFNPKVIYKSTRG